MISREKLILALNEFVDNYCDMFGQNHAIVMLIEQCAYTKEDLLELGFSEDNIDTCFNDPDAALESEEL